MHLPGHGRGQAEQVVEAGVGQQAEVGPGHDRRLVGGLGPSGQHLRDRHRGRDRVRRRNQSVGGSAGRGRTQYVHVASPAMVCDTRVTSTSGPSTLRNRASSMAHTAG